MKHLLKYLKDYTKESVLAPTFKFLEALFELLVPLVMANIIGIGIPNQDTITASSQAKESSTKEH